MVRLYFRALHGYFLPLYLNIEEMILYLNDKENEFCAIPHVKSANSHNCNNAVF